MKNNKILINRLLCFLIPTVACFHRQMSNRIIGHNIVLVLDSIFFFISCFEKYSVRDSKKKTKIYHIVPLYNTMNIIIQKEYYIHKF